MRTSDSYMSYNPASDNLGAGWVIGPPPPPPVPTLGYRTTGPPAPYLDRQYY